MKTITTLGITVFGTCAAMGGMQAAQPIVAPSLTAPPVERYVALPFSVSLTGGVMYEKVQPFVDGKSGGTNLPSLLYGGTLGGTWDFAKTGAITHSATFSVGYYQGSEQKRHSELFNSGGTLLSGISDSDIDVDAIPLTLSYNVKYDATGSITLFGGIRTGAMIRHTTANGKVQYKGWSNVVNQDTTWKDASSTKVLPMCGFGVGVQAYITSRWSAILSYDVVWTFGNDCDPLTSTDKQWQYKATSLKHRYYGTFNVGVIYSF